MDINQKIYMGMDGLIKYGSINIVIFGDSISQGSFDTNDVDAEAVYWHKLEIMLHKVNNYMPINMINSSIGGTTATASVPRIQRDITAYHPDLVIVSFGVNDVNGTIEDYLKSLKTIYTESIKCGAQVIHLTQNMLNTYVSDKVDDNFIEYASKMANIQNNGTMDKYVKAAMNLAKECGVKVCDCYKEWKNMFNSGVDTTALLVNHINHPSKEMHTMFAKKLFDTIIKDNEQKDKINKNTMFQN